MRGNLLLLALVMRFLVNRIKIQMRNLGLIAIKDLSQFLKCRTTSLHVEEVNKEQLHENPNGIESGQVPMIRHFFPRNRVGVISKHKCCLDRQVHDHETLGTELVRQDFERVCDEKTRPGECVEDAEEPDKRYLWVASLLDVEVFLVLSGEDGPAEEHEEHAGGGDEEKRSTADAINEEGTADADDETEQGLTSVELFTISTIMIYT